MLEELNMLSNPKSRVAEAVKTIRTNLEFSLVNGGEKKIMLTSTEPGEGKSFIAASLAQSYALSGKKVLIIGGVYVALAALFFVAFFPVISGMTVPMGYLRRAEKITGKFFG